MSIENKPSYPSKPDSGHWSAYADSATIGSDWTDISKLREIAGRSCLDDVRQVVSEYIPDDLNLDTVFA